MQLIYKQDSHKTMLPPEVQERIEACELALLFARGAGMSSVTIHGFEKELEYWQKIQDHNW